jgi:hypothetical protein
MKITKLFLAAMVVISMSACAKFPIVSGDASFSGKDTIKTINMVWSISKITKPGLAEEINVVIKNIFGFHKNVH